MRYELEQKLFDRFNFFHPEKITTSLMCFGFECNDGWFDIIWDLCEDIERLLKKSNIDIEVIQVKEKFGGLRFYWNFIGDFLEIEGEDEGALTDEADRIYNDIESLIKKAEEISYQTCEVCGKPGKPIRGGWITTLCEECKKK